MAKDTASVRLTGGAGFQYEDQVGAWFILQMLSGRQPLGPEYGVVTSVNFQVKESGWLLDDLLIKLSDDNTEHRIPISVKSYRYVTRNGFPSDFVDLIWRQWLGEESTAFDPQSDLLGLVVGRLADSVKDAWDDLLHQAADTEPVRMVDRLNAGGQLSAMQQAIFDSLQCPSGLQRPNDTDAATAVELVKHLRLIRLELRETSASDAVSAIAVCQSVLESNDSSEAVEFWRELVGFASELRTSGGSTDLPKTIRRLCPQFCLKNYPDHERDWRQLLRVSGQAMSIVRGEIQGRPLTRDKVCGQIRNKVSSTRVLALLGESGCGKSALVKGLLENDNLGSARVWLNGEMLDKTNMVSVEQRLGIHNSLVKVLKSASSSAALLVIDGVDRFSALALGNAALILTELGLGEDDCQWHVIITCQPDFWDAVLKQLMAHRISREWIGQHVVEMPRLSEIDSFLGQFSSLRLPTLSPDIRPLLRNLKTLDWIVSAAINDPNVDARGWAGVSDVIEWIWEQWITGDEDQYAKAATLKELASTEGDALVSGVSINTLDVSKQQALPELQSRGLLQVAEERVWFTHDLAGDWARLRLLIGEQGNLDFQRSKVRLPRWHRAIRMYAQRTLERDRNGATKWRNVVTALDNDSLDDVALRDLYLEAAALAINSSHLLERIWADLVGNSSRLLARLLERFLHAATIPDPRITELADSEQDVGALSATMRVPYWPYWGPILSLLDRHKEELPVNIQQTVAKVCCLWLETLPAELRAGYPWPWRLEAAQTALRMAREVQATKAEGAYFRDNEDQKAYEALLNAAPDLPDEVTQVALELCGRKDPDPQITARAERAAERRREEREEFLRTHPENVKKLAELRSEYPASLGRTDWPLRKPWPDGPERRADESFRKVCLQKQTITRLIGVQPEIARKIILALCIEEPKPESPFRYHDMMLNHLGTKSIPDEHPPMFFRGPFLNFLRLNPQVGLETILALVNFATDRWLESQQAWAQSNGQTLNPEILQVTVPLADHTAQWIGDQRVYGWFRNHLISANLVVSALMACEKWLYDLLDADEDINSWILQILQGSRSVAFAGLLAEVGKKKHELLEGPLMPLLGVWQIYDWDHQLVMNGDVWGIEMMSWTSWGERIWSLVRDWHIMPHRKESIQQLGTFYLLTDEKAQRFFDAARQQWTTQLEVDPTNKTLELIIARFDPVNYRTSEAENGKLYVELEWPEKLRAETEAVLYKSQTGMELWGFPVTCRRILDGEQKLTQDALLEFWARLTRLADLDTSQDPDLSADRIAAAICGGIAVLFCKHKSWVEEDEERSKWCAERLLSIVASPPPRNPIDIPQSVTTIRWDCFAAEAVVALLADAPSSKFARQLVAESVTSYYYGTTAFTMQSGYRFRDELSEDFSRMQNLAVLWAALRALRYRGEVLKADLTQWTAWYDRLIDSFVRKALPVERISWDRIESFASRSLERMERRYRTQWWEPATDEPSDDSEESAEAEDGKKESNTPIKPGIRRKRAIRLPGFDIQVLKSAFSWLPELPKALDANERRNWITLWRELLAVVLRMVGFEEAGQNEELSSTPYDYDRWVFKEIAQMIPQMTCDERPEELWRPILELGPTAHYWVEDFLRDWTIYGPDASSSPAKFVEHWRPMIEHCLGSPKWDAKGRGGFRLDKMYINLMGLGLGLERVGREEFATPISSMLNLYEQWAKNWLGQWYVMRYFVVFLTKPAARDIVCPAVKWICSAVEEYEDYDWRGFNEGDLESLITDALRTCWLQHRQTVQRNDDLRTAFIDLLTILTNRLCPSAMELRDEVLRSLAR